MEILSINDEKCIENKLDNIDYLSRLIEYGYLLELKNPNLADRIDYIFNFVEKRLRLYW